MNAIDRLLGADATALANGFATGDASPVQALDACLERIARLDDALGAFNQLDDPARLTELAGASAARWRAGRPLSPLDGVPFGVKANIAIAGLPWHAGVAARRHLLASEDAGCVAQLRAAGLIPLGHCNMHEAALGVTSANPAYQVTRNPRDRKRIPGGSSGGSAAAVAAGLAPLALGTDDLGSVRLPSAFCSVVGFKPAFGDIDTTGLLPLSRQLDHIGFHTRSVRDVAALMRTLVGSLPAPAPGAVLARWRLPASLPLAGCMGRAWEQWLLANPVATEVDWSDVDLSALRRAGLLICEREGARTFADVLRGDPQGVSQTLRDLLAWGEAQDTARVARAEARMQAAAGRLRRDLSGRILLSPTCAQPPPGAGEDAPDTLADLTAPAAIAGVPAISVPALPGELSPGLQIAGLETASVLATAARLFPGLVETS